MLKNFATFYKSSNINFGLVEILENETYLQKMKLKVDFTQKTITFQMENEC